MNFIKKAAVNVLLNYVSDNPMEKLPKMFSIAEKLDRSSVYQANNRNARSVAG